MMSARELGLGLVGAWRLGWNDASGVQFFDRSAEGAVRSFGVMLLLAPAYAVLTAIEFADLELPQVGLREIARAAALYVVDWLLFLVLVQRAATVLGRVAHFPAYIAAHNYLQVPIYGMALFVTAIGGMVPEAAAGMLGLALLTIVVVAHFRVLRQMMDLTPAQTAVLVAAGFCLSLALQQLGTALFLADARPVA